MPVNKLRFLTSNKILIIIYTFLVRAKWKGNQNKTENICYDNKK